MSTDEGRAAVESIARRHDVPAEAAEVLLAAIRRGDGRQAQFSHPALGGMGQWSRGGGIMIGDMFNHALKDKVERLCSELAEVAGEPPVGMAGLSSGDWWPRDLGRPSAVGSQNKQGYACFPGARRLAIRGSDGVQIYDTADHRITDVSQQQSGTRDLIFTSQHGTIRVANLKPVGKEKKTTTDRTGSAEAISTTEAPRAEAPTTSAGSDVLELIERLHELQRKGVLTPEEYAAKKTELLARL